MPEFIVLSILLVFGIAYFSIKYNAEKRLGNSTDNLMSEFIVDDFNKNFNFIDKYFTTDLGKTFKSELIKTWDRMPPEEKPVKFKRVSKKRLAASKIQYRYLLTFKKTNALYFTFEYHKKKSDWVMVAYKMGSFFELLYEQGSSTNE